MEGQSLADLKSKINLTHLLNTLFNLFWCVYFTLDLKSVRHWPVCTGVEEPWCNKSRICNCMGGLKPGTHQADGRLSGSFSQCVPHRRLKLVLVCFFSASEFFFCRSVGPSDHSDWLFS